jgi:Kef-type K+ transport system membrane component KefB
MDTRTSLQLGALMNTRGLMELIALNIGYDLGILSQRIFTMLVIMAYHHDHDRAAPYPLRQTQGIARRPAAPKSYLVRAATHGSWAYSLFTLSIFAEATPRTKARR